jgi:hypothetical protein
MNVGNGDKMKKKLGIAFGSLGILFLLYAIFGRYLVLPGYFQSLAAGASGAQLPDNVPLGKVLRYLLWAFSFKLGIYFFILGAMIFSQQRLKNRVLFSIIGFIYLSFAYMDLPFHSSLFFGIGGGILTLSFLFLFTTIGQVKSENPHPVDELFLYLGYFFLSMAAYNLCPFCGVKCFALEPEKMIQYGLQSQAISFANHIMIELVLGFICICIARSKLVFTRKAIT